MRITILAHPELGSGDTFGDTVGQVAAGLRKGSHRVSILGVHRDIGRLISGLKRRQPDLIFNLMEPASTDGPSATAMVGLLDVLGLPYTGSNPGEFFIQQDTTIARTLLAVDGRPTHQLRLNGNGTNGTHHARYREFRVGLLGNEEPIAFSPVEMITPLADAYGGRLAAFGRLNGGATVAELACCLADDLRESMLDAARGAYRALRMRDYGQVVLRLRGGETVEPAGVRADCDLGQNGEFARAAADVGIDFVELVNRVAELAIERAGQRVLTRLI